MLLALLLLCLQTPSLSAAEARIAGQLRPLGGELQYVNEGKMVLSLDVQNDHRRFDFGAVRELSNLYALRVFQGSIDEKTLPQLRGLTNLHLLVMLTDGLTDAGFADICRLKHLDKLDVMSKRITVKGLVHLSELKDLKRLYLYNTTITDADLEPLCGLKQLDVLNVPDTVDEAGVYRLKAALPKTQLRRG